MGQKHLNNADMTFFTSQTESGVPILKNIMQQENVDAQILQKYSDITTHVHKY